jgi:hypothetical protein
MQDTPYEFSGASLLMGLGHKVNKSDRSTNSQPSMPRLKSAVLAVSTETRAIETAKFCQILYER